MLALTVGHWLPLVATVRRAGPSVDISTRRGFLNTMNTLNSMLRSIPLATMVVVALLVLATGTVSAAPRQQTLDICSRTQEVQDAIILDILGKGVTTTCSTITDTQLASIQYLFTDGYSSDTVIPDDFANLTGLVELGIFDSSALTAVPASAFSEVTGYSNLINVGLVRNVITDVHIDAFEGLFGGLPDGFSGQITLALGDNLIETLEPGVFDGLSNLTNLALSNNNIQNLEPGIFDGLGMLTKLSLANNGLKGLDNAVFRDLSELEILYLGTNKLSGLDAGTFNGLTKLQQLTLTNNGLSVLPAGIFNGLTELRVLHLEANSLTDLDAAIFAGLDDSLWNLYLNSNRLSTLPSGIFAGLTGLQTLDLNNNGISTLPADVFAPLDDSLGAIALSRNSLSSLDADIFDGLTGLEYLHLQGNSLSSLPAGIFDGLTGLQRLYLNDNSLSTLPANVFAPLDDTLQHVYLSNNNLSSLDADTFDGLTGLIGLYIENNDSLSSLPATIFEDLDESLLYLHLGNNNLSSLDVDIFDGLTGLERLYLNHNSLSSLDADIFDGLTALERLYLNHNSLSSLPATIFEDLDDSLWHLVLTKNTVATLPTDIFGGLTGLQGLDLSCNSLNALPLARFDPFASSLTYLDVSGNGYGSTPTDTDLRNKFTQITDMSGSLYTGVNTECLPPYEFGLSGLSLSTGTLNPAFQAPGKDVYNTRVGHDVSSITVTVTPKDSRAMIEPRSGSNWEYDNDETTPGIQVDLTGVRTNIGWQVRVRNGAFSYPYQIAVYLDHPTATNALLRSLELSGAPLDETFDGRTDTYTATAAASETTVTATPLDPDATPVIKLNGTVDSDGTVVLNVGSNNVITVEVTAEDGTTMQTYTVTVMRTTAPGVSVLPKALTVREEDTTGASYTVVLDSQPTAGVTVTVAGHSGTDVTTSPATLTFTTSNWGTPQTVTVTAGDDADTTNDTVTLTHSATSADSDYSGISIASVAVTVNDNDTANVAPTFNEGASTSRTFNETLGDEAVATLADIGNPVAATDSGDTLTYSLEGTDMAKFGIVRTSGQLQTKVGQKYDYEAKSSYLVTVKVVDSQGASDTIAVTLNVMDQDEAPLAPDTPSVSATTGSTTSLDVSWTAPTNTGRPAITNYDLRYRVKGASSWTNGPRNVTNTSTSIPDLDSGTSYEVQVRAVNGEGEGGWSASGTGRTDTPTAPGVSVLPTVLTVTEEDTAGASYTVVLDSQPTADVRVTVGGHAGTEVTPTPTSLTFTTSNWESAQMVTVTAGNDADTTNDTVTLTHSATSADSDYSGISIDSVAVTVNDIAVGICGRTKEVRDALVDLIPGVSGCAAVTAADLAAITGTLDLSGQSIADLAAGDFVGLTSLMELYLDNNKLPELPDDVFAGLTSLEVLYLNNNDLTELPGGVFEPLTSLEVLYLNNNDLTTLPGGVFDQLTMLKVLTLYYNALTMLPDGVFELLTRLNFLYMEDNPGVPFAPTADALPDAGRVAVDGGTVRLDGSGSGGPWGTNISYSWALTTPASGVTFDDATSVTPEVTIPELAADTELTFTLTVTGRGHIGSGTATATATATAKVTATLNITNNPPVFAGGTAQARILAETLGDAAVTTASDIGAPVSATDTDTGDTLTYVLLGADRDKFTFDTSSGQIKTRSGESYDYEAQSSYSVTVAVIDGTVTVSAAVTINVTDQNEPPLAMTAPMVTVTQESATSLEVSWTEPTNTGRPNIDSYDLQYRVGNTGGFINGPQDKTGTSAPIGKLTANTSYEVQVRATNAEGDGAWSVAGSGTTGTTTTTDTPGVSVSPTALTVTEGDTTGDSYTVVLDSQPTADVTVTVGGHAGTEVTPTPTSLIFTTSNWSTAQTVTVTAADTVTMNDTVTLTHSAESTDSNYSSITIADVMVTVNDDDTAAGICGRTAEVRDALLRLIENNEGAAVACADVTAAQLAAITGPLDLAVENITALATGDFAGLTALKTLNLDHNKLTALPDDMFAGLTALKVLYLNDNRLTALPDDVFDGLTALEFLYLGNNELTMLPEDVFAGLTSLKLLYLDNNGLTALPDNVFEPLTALKVLRLQGNPVASFAPEADARPDNGTVPVGGGTVRLDGSGSGGAWGTNVAYRWALTSPGSGVTVMFDNDRSATPVVTIPELTAGTALTFTLTVTGRGHIGSATGIGTDTAKVTATDSVTASGDATLGGLTVNDGTSDLTLAPAFALGTFVYTASVGNAVATVTLTATVNHAGASVSAVTLDGNAIADSDFTDGITVSSLIEGGNGIVVTVTAENGATQTYTVTVSRAATTATAAGVSVSETALTVTEGDTTGASYTVVLDTQPTAGVTVTVAGHSGTDVTPNPTSLIFTTSNWNTAQTITVTAADTVTMNDTVTLTHSAASTDSNYSSITIADVTVTVNDDDTAAGICPRTPQVRDALVALIPGVSDCADVTAAQLAAITGPLKLSSQSINELAAGDFAGLTALKTLNLFNNKLPALPDDVFAGLTALKTLNLDHNKLTALPDDVFAGLTALKVLYLNDNRLPALPDDVFDGLTALEFLYLGKNKQLTELPVGVFAGLTALKLLYLDNNGLTSLPDGVFEGLISLQVLRLQGNPVASFAPTADARPDDGTVPVAGGTVTLDGSGSGGPWGTNVTYRWALTTPVSGVTVMFDNATSAMPEATIQALAADTELTFTLTVTGRGHIGSGTDTGTDTAKVTATEPMARAARSNSVPQPERRQSAGRHRWGRR